MPVVRGRLGSTRVALLTVTIEEFEAVGHIFDICYNIAATPYFVHDRWGDEAYDVVLRRLPGQTNTVATEGAGAFIEDFRPEFLIIVGTCGGHSDRDGVSLGDVIVADYIDFAGYWKYKKGAVLQRKTPHDHPSAYLLQNFVEPLRVSGEWVAQVVAERPRDDGPKLMVGGIVSGDILLGDPHNAEQRRILKHFDKAYAFEMEGYGVARAVYNARRSVHYNPQFLVVRGVSDLVDVNAEQNQEVRQQWTPYAVAAAANSERASRSITTIRQAQESASRCFGSSHRVETGSFFSSVLLKSPCKTGTASL